MWKLQFVLSPTLLLVEQTCGRLLKILILLLLVDLIVFNVWIRVERVIWDCVHLYQSLLSVFLRLLMESLKLRLKRPYVSHLLIPLFIQNLDLTLSRLELTFELSIIFLTLLELVLFILEFGSEVRILLFYQSVIRNDWVSLLEVLCHLISHWISYGLAVVLGLSIRKWVLLLSLFKLRDVVSEALVRLVWWSFHKVVEFND